MLASQLLQRLIRALVVILGVACLVFALMHMIPGDPVDVMLGESASLSDRSELRTGLGLDLPVVEQLGRYFSSLARFDLGHSIHSKQPVGAILAERIPVTATLAIAALGFALLVALPAGIVSALRRGSIWDRMATGISLIGISVPNFWMGPLLILLFSVWLGWLPVSGQEQPGSWVLPAITLGTAMAAILARMLRSSLLEVLGGGYMQTARAKGLSNAQVIFKHGLRNAALPMITLLGLQLGALLGGTVITEAVFSWPGVGMLLVEAIQKRDYPVVQGCVLLISMVYVIVNLLTELAYVVVDPRIRRWTT